MEGAEFGSAHHGAVAQFWSKRRYGQTRIDLAEGNRDLGSNSRLHVWRDHQTIVTAGAKERGSGRMQIRDLIHVQSFLPQQLEQRMHRLGIRQQG